MEGYCISESVIWLLAVSLFSCSSMLLSSLSLRCFSSSMSSSLWPASSSTWTTSGDPRRTMTSCHLRPPNICILTFQNLRHNPPCFCVSIKQSSVFCFHLPQSIRLAAVDEGHQSLTSLLQVLEFVSLCHPGKLQIKPQINVLLCSLYVCSFCSKEMSPEGGNNYKAMQKQAENASWLTIFKKQDI